MDVLLRWRITSGRCKVIDRYATVHLTSGPCTGLGKEDDDEDTANQWM